jgi:hypothetical protein
MRNRIDARTIRVLAGAGVACLSVAIICVHTLHKENPASRMSEENLAYIQRNMALYSECEFAEISDTRDFFDKLANRVNQLVHDELSEEKKQALVSFLGSVLVARSEGDWDKYRSALGSGMKARVPGDRLGSCKRNYERHTLKRFPSTSPAECIAEEFFHCESQWDDGALRMQSCSFENDGMRLAHLRFGARSEVNDTLSKVEPEKLAYWFGPIVKSAYIFFQPETNRDVVLRDHDYVDWVDFQTIMKTRGNDIHPIRIRCWYHPVLEHWVIAGVDRQSSVMLTSIPNTAY